MNDENITVEQEPDPDPEPAKTVAPMSDTNAKAMLDESDAEYSDVHVFYHDTMNFLADRVFINNDRIDYHAAHQEAGEVDGAPPAGAGHRNLRPT